MTIPRGRAFWLAFNDLMTKVYDQNPPDQALLEILQHLLELCKQSPEHTTKIELAWAQGQIDKRAQALIPPEPPEPKRWAIEIETLNHDWRVQRTVDDYAEGVRALADFRSRTREMTYRIVPILNV